MCIDCLHAADLNFFVHFFSSSSDTLLDICGTKCSFYSVQAKTLLFIFQEIFCSRCCFMKINISTSTWNKRFWSAQKFSLWSAWSCKWILLFNRMIFLYAKLTTAVAFKNIKTNLKMHNRIFSALKLVEKATKRSILNQQ